MSRSAGLSLWEISTVVGSLVLCSLAGCVSSHPVRSASDGLSNPCTPVVICASPVACASSQATATTPEPSATPPPTVSLPPTASFPPSVFPPQTVMETGNYAEFVTENDQKLQTCEQSEGCDVALFNLGFAYAYAANPHRNLVKASIYLDDLRRRYPDSPYAFPAKAWRSLILERLALEEDLRTAHTQLRGKDDEIRALHEQMERARALDIEMQEKERKLLQLR